MKPSRAPSRAGPGPRRLGMGGKGQGFTLIEVLVALGIVAIALMAGFRASTALSQNAQRQTDVFLAQLCAENAQSAYRLAGALPGLGQISVDCRQADRLYTNQIQVQPTPNPNFRRIEVRVLRDGVQVLQLSSIVGNL